MESRVPRDDCAIECSPDLTQGMECEVGPIGEKRPPDREICTPVFFCLPHCVQLRSQSTLFGGSRGTGSRREDGATLSPHIASTILAVSCSALMSPVYPIHPFPSRPNAAGVAL